MGNVIQIKRGSTVPANGALADGELGYNKTDGFLYIGVDNKSVKIKAEGSSGVLSLAQGGTGTTFSEVATDSIIVKGSGSTLSAKYPTVTGADTNGGGAVYYTESGTLMINILPLSKGGVGADLRDAATNSVIIKEVIGDSHKLSFVPPPTNNSGALVSGVLVYDNSADSKGTKFIRSLPLTLGGTGANLSSVTANSVIIKDPTANSSRLSSIAPSNGAFYYNGSSLNFGILPASIGGTGADLSRAATDSIIAKGSGNTLLAKRPAVIGTGTGGGGAVYYTEAGTLSFGTLPISKGGTGATTAANALSNLGLVTPSVEGELNGDNVFMELTSTNRFIVLSVQSNQRIAPVVILEADLITTSEKTVTVHFDSATLDYQLKIKRKTAGSNIYVIQRVSQNCKVHAYGIL